VPKGKAAQKRPKAKQHKRARRQSNTTGNEVKDFVNYRERGKSILLASGENVDGENVRIFTKVPYLRQLFLHGRFGSG